MWQLGDTMTNKEVEKLVEYLNIKGYLNNNFNGYSRLYSMTTENIFGFLSKYDFKDKKVLTVAGSGDQRLNSYLLGANNVTCFDINPICELHLKLKDTAIKELSYSDFLKFFGIITSDNTNTFFTEEIFNKFRNLLDDDVYTFYNYVINEFRRNPDGNVYFDFENKLSNMKKFNGYFSKDNYYKLSDILEKRELDFINVNVDNLPEVLDGEKFDFILLSNISDYIHHIYSDNHIERFRELVDKLKDNLNLYGLMQVGYIYSRYSRGEDVSRFHLKNYRHTSFTTDMFYSCFVDSYYQDGTYDKVITYQKYK